MNITITKIEVRDPADYSTDVVTLSNGREIRVWNGAACCDTCDTCSGVALGATLIEVSPVDEDGDRHYIFGRPNLMPTFREKLIKLITEHISEIGDVETPETIMHYLISGVTETAIGQLLTHLNTHQKKGLVQKVNELVLYSIL